MSRTITVNNYGVQKEKLYISTNNHTQDNIRFYFENVAAEAMVCFYLNYVVLDKALDFLCSICYN